MNHSLATNNILPGLHNGPNANIDSFRRKIEFIFGFCDKSHSLLKMETGFSHALHYLAISFALAQRECEEKIATETKARETVAQITELERASVARKAFDVSRLDFPRKD
jgi:hypothetical protein